MFDNKRVPGGMTVGATHDSPQHEIWRNKQSASCSPILVIMAQKGGIPNIARGTGG
jgi:hypothetical protein